MVNEQRCQALLKNKGVGKLQCRNWPLLGSDLCPTHSKGLAFGRVTGPLSDVVLEKFRTELLKKPQDSQVWYSRHLMWHYAENLFEGVESVNGLDDYQYEQCLKAIQEHIKSHSAQTKPVLLDFFRHNFQGPNKNII